MGRVGKVFFQPASRPAEIAGREAADCQPPHRSERGGAMTKNLKNKDIPDMSKVRPAAGLEFL